MFVYGHCVGRWLGRWLCCWLGVLAAGCGTRNAVPAATLVPLATMPDYSRVPPTRAPVWRLRLTPTRAAVLTISASPPRATLLVPLTTPAPISLDPPTCYETPVGSLWCLGLIHNPLSVAVMGVRLRVSLVTPDGLAVLSQETASARQWLPAGATAPYAVLFNAIPTGPAGPVAEVLRAETAQNGLLVAIPLTTRDTHANLEDNRYHIQAIIENTSAYDVQPSVVITLLDGTGRVTGLRQVVLAHLFASTTVLPLDIDGIAVAPGATQFTIAADGLLLQAP